MKHKSILNIFDHVILLKYLYISAISLIVDYSVYLVLVYSKLLSIPIASAAGYSAGMVLSYLLLITNVFTDGWLKQKRLQESILFLISGALGITLTYLTSWLVLQVAGPRVQLAKLLSVMVSFFSVYLFRKLIVFRKKRIPIQS